MQATPAHTAIGRDRQRAKIFSAIYGASVGRSVVCLLEGTIGSGTNPPSRRKHVPEPRPPD